LQKLRQCDVAAKTQAIFQGRERQGLEEDRRRARWMRRREKGKYAAKMKIREVEDSECSSGKEEAEMLRY
jgi:hypothetical protein